MACSTAALSLATDIAIVTDADDPDHETGSPSVADVHDAVRPADDRLSYDEIAVGDRFESDRAETFTRESIVDFAAAYDPQPFHLDSAAGEASPFGGLVASGLHTLCVCSRLATEAFFGRIAFLGGRGVDDLRWHRPVRPGDSLSVAVVVAHKRPSESTPGRGYVDVDVTAFDSTDREIVSWRVLAMVRRADAAAHE